MDDRGLDAAFVDAVHAAANGDSRKLQDYLRTIPILERPELHFLADYLDGDMLLNKGNHARFSPNELGFRRWSVERVRTVQKWWRRRNRPLPLKDAISCIAKKHKIDEDQLAKWHREPKKYGADVPVGYKWYRNFSRDSRDKTISPVYLIRPLKRPVEQNP